MQEFHTLSVSKRPGGAAQVLMSRPAVSNAFDELMIGELDEAFAALAQDPDARVIVLAGQGKNFSAGADLAWMQRASGESQEWNLRDARRFAAMFQRIAACPRPTVARVQGAALGGGVGLACACDIAIGSEHASFCLSEAKFGILPAVIGPYLLRAIGERQARRLALSAARIGAPEALNLGLLHRVATADALDEAIDACVTELLAGGPMAQGETKVFFDRLARGEVDGDEREFTAATIARMRTGAEAREGFAAFMGKRAPKWSKD